MKKVEKKGAEKRHLFTLFNCRSHGKIKKKVKVGKGNLIGSKQGVFREAKPKRVKGVGRKRILGKSEGRREHSLGRKNAMRGANGVQRVGKRQLTWRGTGLPTVREGSSNPKITIFTKVRFNTWGKGVESWVKGPQKTTSLTEPY